MKLKISDIATVQMGYSFRSRLEASGEGDVAVIQMKDLDSDNVVDCKSLMYVDMDSVKEHHLAQKGDLVFRSRGQVINSAILLDDPGMAVVAAPLLRIRIAAHNKVLPEYLNWYFSQSDAQSYLTGMAGGTAQKIINKHAVENMEVVLPSLERQSAVVELAGLAAKEQDLLRQISKKRDQYVTAMLMEIIKGE